MASVAEEIAIKLGVKTGDLKAALTDAGASIKKLKADSADGGEGFVKSFGKAKQSIEIFKSVLAGAGIVGLVKQIFASAVEYAEKYEGAFDADVAATLRVRDAQKELEKTTGKIAAAVVGLMDKFGTAVGGLVYGFDAASDALVKMDEEAKKAFDDARAKKLLEATEKLEKVRHDAALAAGTDDEKINLLAAEYVKLLEEQSKLKKGSIEWIEKATVAEAKAAELRKVDSDARKKEEEDRKKAADEEKKAQDDINQRRALAAKDELELYQLQRKNKESLTAEDKKRLEILELQKTELVTQVEIEDLLKLKNTEGLTPAEAKRLDELIKQDKKLKDQIETKGTLTKTTSGSQLDSEKEVTEEMAEQIRKEQEITAEKEKQAALERAKHISVTQEGDVRTLNEVQLDQLVQNISKQLESLKATTGPLPLGYTPPEILILQNALDNARKEQAARRSFEQTQRAFGDEYTQRNFSPDDYNRLSQLFDPNQAKQQAQDISSIASTLHKLAGT